MRVVGTVTIFALLISCVLCNTEIVNFDVDHLPEISEDTWSSWNLLATLTPSNKQTYHVEVPERDCSVRSGGSGATPVDTWYTLDIPSSRKGPFPNRYTVRISWPATLSVNFDIEVFRLSGGSAGTMSGLLPTLYARIRTRSTGIRSNCSRSGVLPSMETIHFDVILEPLIGGVLPESLLPMVLSLFPITAIFWVMARHVASYLDRTARAAEISFQKGQ